MNKKELRLPVKAGINGCPILRAQCKATGQIHDFIAELPLIKPNSTDFELVLLHKNIKTGVMHLIRKADVSDAFWSMGFVSDDWPEDVADWPKTAGIIQGGISKATAIKFTGPQPTRATAGSAAYDLRYTPTDGDSVIVRPNDTEILPTGLSIELPEGYAALVCSRSGLAAKHGIQVLNAPEVIDSDYRGEIGVILHNNSDYSVIFRAGDRIAQLMIVPVLSVDWVSVDALGQTDRGDGGFGSTGVE